MDIYIDKKDHNGGIGLPQNVMNRTCVHAREANTHINDLCLYDDHNNCNIIQFQAALEIKYAFLTYLEGPYAMMNQRH